MARRPTLGYNARRRTLGYNVRVPGDPGYDPYDGFENDPFGGHDDISSWHEDARNNAIRRARLQQRIDHELAVRDPRIERFRRRRLKMYDELPGKFRDDTRKLSREWKSYVKDLRSMGADARNRWRDWADRSASAMQSGIDRYAQYGTASAKTYDQGLSRWKSQYGDRMSGLNAIKRQQSRLMNELANAPSSVAEQAQQIADQSLQTATALGAVTGGTAGGVGMSLANQSNNQFANLLRSSSAQRMQERLGILGAQQQLMGQQAGLEGQMAGLGTQDANVHSQFGQLYRGLGLDQYNMGAGQAGLLSNLGGQGASLDVNIMNQLRQNEFQRLQMEQTNQRNRLLANLAQIEGYKYEGQDIQAHQDLAYNRAIAHRNFDDMENRMLNAQTKQRIKGIATFGIGALLGGVGGGFMGALKGGAGAVGLGQFNQQQQAPQQAQQQFPQQQFPQQIQQTPVAPLPQIPDQQRYNRFPQYIG